MLSIPKEIVVYALKRKNQNFLVILSISQGWGLLKVDSDIDFITINYKKIVNSYKKLIINFLLGFYRFFSQFIKLKGMGYKSIILSSKLIFKLGYSHRILYKVYKDIKLLYISKQLLLFVGRSINKIKNIVYNLQCLRKANVYKKKGIFLKGSIIKIKQSSKKSKF